jgi:hypothetical protein
MPKTEIDYSNTIIYKITCKDSAVTDVYVGHTTNFVQRKHAHKQSCINNKSANHTCKVYQVIRANGGWNNWKMEIINFFDCKDHYEARKKEQEYFISLNANLNSIEPMPKPKVKDKEEEKKEKEIIVCNMEYSNVEEHNKTNTQLIVDVENTKKHNLFNCEKCNFNCSKKSEWERHLVTRKHISLTTLTEKTPLHVCIHCSKKYNSREGLWYHKKTCNKDEDTSISENSTSLHAILSDNKDFKKFILEVVKNNTELQKQNTELQKQLIDILKINTDK